MTLEKTKKKSKKKSQQIQNIPKSKKSKKNPKNQKKKIPKKSKKSIKTKKKIKLKKNSKNSEIQKKFKKSKKNHFLFSFFSLNLKDLIIFFLPKKKKKCFSLSFPILWRNSTRALQSSPFQNPGGVAWAWRGRRRSSRTALPLSNIGWPWFMYHYTTL